jgi:hypothetical protein
LFKQQLSRGIDDEALARETGEIFNPKKNPFIGTGLLALLDRGARAPKMDYACSDKALPGWQYPAGDGTSDDGDAQDDTDDDHEGA